MVRGKLWGCNVRVNYRFLKVFHEKQSALFRLIEYELQNVQFVSSIFNTPNIGLQKLCNLFYLPCHAVFCHFFVGADATLLAVFLIYLRRYFSYFLVKVVLCCIVVYLL